MILQGQLLLEGWDSYHQGVDFYGMGRVSCFFPSTTSLLRTVHLCEILSVYSLQRTRSFRFREMQIISGKQLLPSRAQPHVAVRAGVPRQGRVSGTFIFFSELFSILNFQKLTIVRISWFMWSASLSCNKIESKEAEESLIFDLFPAASSHLHRSLTGRGTRIPCRSASRQDGWAIISGIMQQRNCLQSCFKAYQWFLKPI